MPAATIVQCVHEPLGGQPPSGTYCPIKVFDYQLKYQRAFEAVMWGLPAVSIYRLRQGAFDTYEDRIDLIPRAVEYR